MGLVPKPVTCVQRSVAATTTTTTSATILRKGAGDIVRGEGPVGGDLASDIVADADARRRRIIVLAGWKELGDYIRVSAVGEK